MPERVRRVIAEIVDLWFPRGCAGCGVHGPSPCEDCLGQLDVTDAFPVPEGLDSATALLRYDERSRPFLVALKYRGRRSVADDFARPLAMLMGDVRLGAVAPIITWAPTTPARRRRRGFDQAEVLARRVGRQVRSPVRRTLRRRPGPTQTGLDRRHRLESVHFEPTGPAPEVVVVCDDVLTTGATMTAAARALRRAGAREVHGLVLAHTPVGGAIL